MTGQRQQKGGPPYGCRTKGPAVRGVPQSLTPRAAPTDSLPFFPVAHSLPCSFGALVDDDVAADPSSAHLKGCFGNACVSFCALAAIPYVGSLVAAGTMIPPVYAKIAGPGEPPLNCCTAIMCAGCTVCQLKNEVAIRRQNNVPIVPMQIMVVPMAVQPMMKAV